MQFSQKQVQTITGRIKTLEKLATMLASKGVKVVWGGKECFTNGQTVHIAGFDPEKMLDIKFFRKVLAFVSHEAFHPRYGMDSVNYTIDKPQIWHHMLNIVEDGRINTMGAKEFPGVKSVLMEGYVSLLEDGAYNPPMLDSHPAHVLTNWAILNVIAHVMGFSRFEQNELIARDVASQVFTPGFVNRTDVLLATIPTLQSSYECFVLVEKIMTVLDDEMEEKKKDEAKQQAKQRREAKKQQKAQSDDSPQSPKPDSADSEQGEDDSDDSTQSMTDDSDSQSEPTNDPASDSSDTGDDQEGDTATQASDGDDDADNQPSSDSETEDGQDQLDDDSSADNDQQDLDDDQASDSCSDGSDDTGTGDQLSGNDCSNGDAQKVPSAKTVIKALQKVDDDDVFHDGLASMAEELERIAVTTGSIALNKHPPFYQGKGAYDVSQQVKSKAHQVGQRVRSIVQSINEVPMVAGFIGDELMVQNVARMRFGESRLFTDTTYSQAPNVAFHILLDNSGSMHGSKIQVAKDATASTLLALESIPGVSAALTVFPAMHDSLGASSAVIYKKHSEKARLAISRFGCVNSMGTTPCTEAMGVAIEDLKQRVELRKVMLIITDGEPDEVDGCMASYKLAKMLGMEVYGIGIFGAYDLPDFTDSYQVIHSLDDLPKAMQDITKNSTLSNLMAA